MQDVAGNPLGFNVVFDFTTAFAADTTPPEVMRVDPADGDMGVPTNAEITIELSEAVDPISVTSTTVKLQQGTSVIAGTLSLLDGNRRIKLVLTSLLAPTTSYTLRIAGLQDMADNVLVGSVAVSFTTGAGADLVSPQVVGTNPMNRATGVVRDVVVTVEFSEPLNPLTVNTMTLTLRNLTTGQVVEAAVALDTTRTLATLTPAVLLAPNTVHELDIGGMADTAGNTFFFGGIFFTTGSS